MSVYWDRILLYNMEKTAELSAAAKGLLRLRGIYETF